MKKVYAFFVCMIAALHVYGMCMPAGKMAKNMGGDYHENIKKQMFEAVKNGRYEQVKTLIENDPCIVNKQDHLESFPLHNAAFIGNFDIVELLIKYRANLYKQDLNGWTSLHLAVLSFSKNKYKIIDFLIKNGVSVDIRGFDGNTPLCLAIYNRKIDVAQHLINMGGNVNFCNRFSGKTLLSWVSGQGDTGIMKLLISNNADVNRLNEDGSHPLHDAVYSENIYAVELLVKNGAPINVRHWDTTTPIQFAILSGNLNMVKHLVKNGSKINAWSRLGGPFHYAFLSDNKNKFEMVKYLIEQGVDVNKCNSGRTDEQSPLHLAADHGDVETVKLLAASGANIYRKDDFYNTPRYIAARKGRQQIVEFFDDISELHKGNIQSLRQKYSESELKRFIRGQQFFAL